MLIVAKITRGTAGGCTESLEGKARSSELGDYYVKDGERVEAPGRWVGGANLFGLDSDAPVTDERLRTLMDVRRPDTGGELRRLGASGEAVAVLDATFSAPKSDSAVWALGRRSRGFVRRAATWRGRPRRSARLLVRRADHRSPAGSEIVNLFTGRRSDSQRKEAPPRPP